MLTQHGVTAMCTVITTAGTTTLKNTYYGIVPSRVCEGVEELQSNVSKVESRHVGLAVVAIGATEAVAARAIRACKNRSRTWQLICSTQDKQIHACSRHTIPDANHNGQILPSLQCQ